MNSFLAMQCQRQRQLLFLVGRYGHYTFRLFTPYFWRSWWKWVFTAEVSGLTVVVRMLLLQWHGSVPVQEDGGGLLHPADRGHRRAGQPQPAAALVTHRPCLLLVDGLLVGLQHLLQRQFPGLGQVPRLAAVRAGGYSPRVPVLGGFAGESSHDCDGAEPIVYLSLDAKAMCVGVFVCVCVAAPPLTRHRSPNLRSCGWLHWQQVRGWTQHFLWTLFFLKNKSIGHFFVLHLDE